MGNLFERQVLKDLWTKFRTGASFEITRLYPSGHHRQVNEETSRTINAYQGKEKVFIPTIEDIKRLKDGEFGIPSVSNFPLIDLVVKPNFEIQITIAKSHAGAKNRHKDIEEGMGGSSKEHMMIFALTKENFDDFRYVEGFVKDVKQYKMLVQWSTDYARPSMESGESHSSRQPPTSSSTVASNLEIADTLPSSSHDPSVSNKRVLEAPQSEERKLKVKRRKKDEQD